MSAGLWVRDSAGVSRNIKKLYTNVGGVTRELKELWVNDAGVARKIYNSGVEWMYEVELYPASNDHYSFGPTADTSLTAVAYDNHSAAYGNVTYKFKQPLILPAHSIIKLSCNVQQSMHTTLYINDKIVFYEYAINGTLYSEDTLEPQTINSIEIDSSITTWQANRFYIYIWPDGGDRFLLNNSGTSNQ